MSSNRHTRELEDRIGYRFKDRSLLLQALTHASQTAVRGGDNERFEFLGDRVLGLVMAELLMEIDPRASVGTLAISFNGLVDRNSCARAAESIGLAGQLRLGKGVRRPAVASAAGLMGDAMEALLAAIYLDGGLAPAREVIRKLWAPMVKDGLASENEPKARLQIWAQARSMALPEYRVVDRTGPEHAPQFSVEARLASGPCATASAPSKRLAEQRAAAQLMAMVEPEDD